MEFLLFNLKIPGNHNVFFKIAYTTFKIELPTCSYESFLIDAPRYCNLSVRPVLFSSPSVDVVLGHFQTT